MIGNSYLLDKKSSTIYNIITVEQLTGFKLNFLICIRFKIVNSCLYLYIIEFLHKSILLKYRNFYNILGMILGTVREGTSQATY